MSKVLVLSPHPDDEALGCGGMLSLHAEAGDEIYVIFLTSGEHGSRVLPPAETAPLREAEANAAAQILGIRQIDFWRAPDGALRCSNDLLQRAASTIRQYGPDYVYTTHVAEAHPDHRAAMRLTLRALRDSRIPWPVLRLFEVWTPLQRWDSIVDITSVIETKRRAVQCYASQLANMKFDEAALALNRYRGALHYPGGSESAEAFVEVKQPVMRRSDGDVTTARVVSSRLMEQHRSITEHDPNAGVCKT